MKLSQKNICCIVCEHNWRYTVAVPFARSSCRPASHDCDIVFYNLIVHFLILYYKPLLATNDPGCYLNGGFFSDALLELSLRICSRVSYFERSWVGEEDGRVRNSQNIVHH